MSRIGKLPVIVPDTVEVALAPGSVKVKGPKGELSQEYPREITVEKATSDEGANTIVVTRPSNRPPHRALHGLVRTLIYNMVHGVTEGYEKRLEIVGVGYRFVQAGSDVDLAAGFSHPVKLNPAEGITFTVIAPNQMSVSGIDKQSVGQSAEIGRASCRERV